jgi:putative phosphoribosyl transferase
MPFVDRVDAGMRLGQQLSKLRGEDVVVLGLPRGGVPVAVEVAKALDAPLDVIVIRKLGVPFQPELAMGAIGEGGVLVLDPAVIRASGVTDAEFAAVEERERAELERRVRRFRHDRPGLELDGRTAIVVDDGIATGSTARAACRVVRAQGAARVVLAAPVATPRAVSLLRADADEVVCLETPKLFYAVGQWYADFTPTTEDEVTALLASVATPPLAATGQAAELLDPPGRDEEVEVVADGVALAGRLTVLEETEGLILFVHGSGSSRHSSRNRFVAGVLNQAGLGTLLFDLLTSEEEGDRARVFDVELLAGRLAEVTRRVRGEHAWVGYFGASTGAAAALWAAAEPDAEVAAVVSRGGRPDLAWPRLGLVRAPTLLIVGSRDELVLDLNRQAQAELRCPSELAVVPGATHLFEEPGALQTVAELARDWFTTPQEGKPIGSRVSG